MDLPFCRRCASLMGGALLSLYSWSAMAEIPATGVEVSVGTRQDNLDWNIAGDTNGQYPNILSELTWTKLDITQLRLDFHADFKQYRLLVTAGRGLIQEGRGRDSDYNLDNRQGEYSRSNSAADGSVTDLSLGVGYRVDLGFNPKRNLYLLPKIGYSVHRQNILQIQGVQVVPASGAFDGLHSTYETKWDGAWLGFTLGEYFDRVRDMSMAFDFVVYRPDYYAKADWNLRPDLVHPQSFEHWADGWGFSAALNGSYELNKRTQLVMSLDYMNMWAKDGLDRVYKTDGSRADTRLNEVNWDSLAFNVGLAVHFP